MASPVEFLLKDELYILVISHNLELLESLQKIIYQTWQMMDPNDEKKYQCKIHISQDIKSVVNQQTTVPVDFVIFIVQCNIVGELQWVESQVKQLGSSFGRNKICLVALGANYAVPISPDQLWTFAISYQYNILIGSLDTTQDELHLSKRILVLAEKCCGLPIRRVWTNEKQTKILATLVPDIILTCMDFQEERMNPMLAVLFCGDISGFTALSDKCSLGGEAGIYKLTSIINEFLGNIVGEIYSHGGDVWKFSGDAFLAIWKVSIEDSLANVIHRSLRCALKIQKTHGYLQTDMKIVLRVKIGISVGNIVWCLVGDNMSRRFLATGPAILEVKEAESRCKIGEVVLGPSAFGHISPRDCVHEVLPDGQFVKITKVVGYLGLLAPHHQRQAGAPEYVDHPAYEEVRQFPDINSREDLGYDLRLTQLSPVIQQVDADLSLDFLTELRTLTLMFINIIPHQIFTTDLLRVADKCYYIIRQVVSKGGGAIDKVTAFDKDVMFLVIYGLRGFYHKGRVPNVLLDGFDIREACLCLEGVKEVTVGICTGVTYCGVVGHALRQAFTAIGPAVNKAARLIQAYPGQVTCDSATYSKAMILRDYFTPAPYRPLRGFSQDDNCYEFNADKARLTMVRLSRGLPPVVGRDTEMTSFRTLLTEVDNPERANNGFIIVGETRVGKSRLMDEMIAETYNQSLTAFVFGVRSSHSIIPYSAALGMIYQAVGMQRGTSWRSLVVRLSNLLQGKIKPSDLSCIEKMVQTVEKNFHSPHKVTGQMKRVFLALLTTTNWAVIAIDDVDFCDSSSWELINCLAEFKSRPLIILAAEANRSDHDFNIRNLIPIRLTALDPHWIAAVACQMTYAEAIHPDVCHFLEMRCRGNPGWCLFQLQTLLDDGYIEIKDITLARAALLHLQYPGQNLLQDRRINMPPPQNVVQVFETEDVIDDAEYDYLDMVYTCRVLSMQAWWQKSKDANYRLANHVQYRAVQEGMRTEIAQPGRETVEWSDLVRGMFTTISLRSTIVRDRGASIFVPVYMPTDQTLILESMEVNKKMKALKDDGGDRQGDYCLDTLNKFRAKKKATLSPEYELLHQKIYAMREEQLITEKPSKAMVWESSTPEVGSSQIGKLSSIEDADDDDDGDDVITDDDIHYQSSRSTPGPPLFLSPGNESMTITSGSVTPSKRIGWLSIIMRVGGRDMNQSISPESYGGLLSVFDSLRPFDQLFLKCSSVIGLKIRRCMVEAILHRPSTTLIAVAIKRLFELNIFYCVKAGKKQDRRCDCSHPTDWITDYSLPAYSFCSEFGFRYPKLRDTMYSLLPPNQKKMFHQRAVEYLASMVRRCNSCHQQESKKLKSSDRKSLAADLALKEGSVIMTKPGKIYLPHDLENTTIPNFLICTCPLKELETLEGLIDHSKASGLSYEALKYSLEIAQVHTSLSSFQEARTALTWVQNEMKESKKLKSSDRKSLAADLALKEGTLEFEMGNIDSAVKHLLSVLEMNFLLCFRSGKGKRRLSILSRIYLKCTKHNASTTDIQALNLLTTIAMENKQYAEALFMCNLALKMLEFVKTGADLKAAAIANKVDIELYYFTRPFVRSSLLQMGSDYKLDSLATSFLPIKSAKAAQSLALVTHSIYIIRVIVMGQIKEYSDLLVALNRLARYTHMTRGFDFTTLEIFHVQLYNYQVKDAAMTLMPLKNGTSAQQFWFHALALDFLRLTGFWLEPYAESETFLTYALTESSADRSAYNMGVVAFCAWLIYVDRPRALQWQSKINTYSRRGDIHNFTECCLRYNEIELLFLYIRGLPGSQYTPRFKRVMRNWLSQLQMIQQRIPILQVYHTFLKLYYYGKIEENVNKALHYQIEGERLSRQLKNTLAMNAFESARENIFAGIKTNVNIQSQLAKLKEWTEWRKNEKSRSIFGII